MLGTHELHRTTHIRVPSEYATHFHKLRQPIRVAWDCMGMGCYADDQWFMKWWEVLQDGKVDVGWELKSISQQAGLAARQKATSRRRQRARWKAKARTSRARGQQKKHEHRRFQWPYVCQGCNCPFRNAGALGHHRASRAFQHAKLRAWGSHNSRLERCGRGVPKEKFQERWRRSLLPGFVETLIPGGWRPCTDTERPTSKAKERECHQDELLQLQGYRALFGVEPFDEHSEEIRTAVALAAAEDPARWGCTHPPAVAAGSGGAASPSPGPSPNPSPSLRPVWSDDDEADYDGYY